MAKSAGGPGGSGTPREKLGNLRARLEEVLTRKASLEKDLSQVRQRAEQLEREHASICEQEGALRLQLGELERLVDGMEK